MPKPMDQINQEFETEYGQASVRALYKSRRDQGMRQGAAKDRAVPQKSANTGDKQADWIMFADTDPKSLSLPPQYYPAQPAHGKGSLYKERKKASGKRKRKKSSKIKKRAKFPLIKFVTTLLLILLGAFLYLPGISIYINQRNGVMPISGFFILPQVSDAAESEITQGSLLVVKTAGLESLSIGDIIVIGRSRAVYAVKKIESINITPDKPNEQKFITAGSSEDHAGSESVHPSQIKGRVIFSIPVLGGIMSFIANNLLVAGIIYICLIFIINTLRKLFMT